MLQDYLQLYQSKCKESEKPAKKKVLEIPTLISDVHMLTLAEAAPQTKDILAAYNLGDYRCMPFQLMLLPKADILFDEILKGGYYGEYISDALSRH